MKFSAPKKITWWISFLVGLFGVLLYLSVLTISPLNAYSFWFVTGALALLLLGNLIKGL